MKQNGDKIRDLRIEKGLSQHTMAEKLGISQNFYWKIENNQTDAKTNTLDKIAKIFDIEKNKLLQLNDKGTYTIEQHNHDSSQNNGLVINQENIEKERQLWKSLEESLRQTIGSQAETIKSQAFAIALLQK